jgi:hypothetical protein
LGSPVIQTPEKSGLPSAIRGEGADMFTLPSAFRGTPGVGYFTHWAAKLMDAQGVHRMTSATMMAASLHRCIPGRGFERRKK